MGLGLLWVSSEFHPFSLPSWETILVGGEFMRGIRGLYPSSSYRISTGFQRRVDPLTSRLKRVYSRRKRIGRIEMSETSSRGTQADEIRGKSERVKKT